MAKCVSSSCAKSPLVTCTANNDSKVVASVSTFSLSLFLFIELPTEGYLVTVEEEPFSSC
jgi:hypothetical protein